MQAISVNIFSTGYVDDMPRGRPSKYQRPPFGERLCALRQAAGLSQQQVADRLDMTQTAYAWWERHHVALKPEQLTRLAGVLGVRVEELLEQPAAARQRGGPVGKARRLFEEISKLPRNQQEKISSVVEAFVAQHGNGHKQAT